MRNEHYAYVDSLYNFIAVTESQTDGFDLYILETVQVVLSINHPFRGHLQVQLISPHGTRSLIGASRPHDK